MIYTIGYAKKHAMQRIITYLNLQEKTYLLDIRYHPYSKWNKQFTKENLQKQFGSKYIHIKSLGNTHFNKKGTEIKLSNPDRAIKKIKLLMNKGYSFILLCACEDYNTCHRKVVYDLLMKEEKDVK